MNVLQPIKVRLALVTLLVTAFAFGGASASLSSQVGPAPLTPAGEAAQADVQISVDLNSRLQTIDGFGVNANGADWRDGRLQPAIDLLAEELGATHWRVLLEEADWEAVNDNADPFNINWDVYRPIYESKKFASLWSTIEALEAKQDAVVILNVMGRLPEWMGRGALSPELEDEWVEMIASMFYYGRVERGLAIPLLSPTNEIDIGAPEGPHLDPEQYVRLLRKLLERLDSLGIGDVGLVPPDIAIIAQAPRYFAPILADSVLMERVQQFSIHDYGGNTGEAPQIIAESNYADCGLWITEFSAGCLGCDNGQRPTDPLNFGLLTFDHLLRHLNAGATGAMVYDAYETFYIHHDANSYWGLLAYDPATGVYSTTRRFYVMAQIFRFVRPGAIRVSTSESDSRVDVLAFVHPTTGAISVVGRNYTGETLELQVSIQGAPEGTKFSFYETGQQVEFERGPDVALSGGALTVTIRGPGVFTLSAEDAPPAPQPEALLLGQNSIEGTLDETPSGMAEAFRYEGAVGGVTRNLHIYLDAQSEASTVVVGLYADGEGGAGALLAKATITAPRAGAWNQVALQPTRLAAGGVYWIAVLSPTGTGPVRFRDRAGGGVAQTSAQANLSALPATWTAGAQWASAPLSAYVSGDADTPPTTPSAEPTLEPTYPIYLPATFRERGRP